MQRCFIRRAFDPACRVSKEVKGGIVQGPLNSLILPGGASELGSGKDRRYGKRQPYSLPC